jgi:integrase
MLGLGLLGVRDRAILAVGLQVGFRRAEIASLKVGDFHMNRGFDSLKVVRKGGKKGSLAIHPQVAQRIRDYLDLAGHGDDLEGPLFRPVRDNRQGLEARRFLHPDVIDRVLRKYARGIGLDRGYSAHSMRATFITRRSITGQAWRMCSQQLGMPIPQLQSSMTGAGTIRRSPRAFLRIIERAKKKRRREGVTTNPQPRRRQVGAVHTSQGHER